MSQFTDAVRAIEPVPECPYCTNERGIERRGNEWFCPVCARCWFATSAHDARFMKVNRIGRSPGDPEP